VELWGRETKSQSGFKKLKAIAKQALKKALAFPGPTPAFCWGTKYSLDNLFFICTINCTGGVK